MTRFIYNKVYLQGSSVGKMDENFEQKVVKEKALPLILSFFLGVDLLMNLQIAGVDSEGHIYIE